MVKKKVIAYAHTHWDKEWYREFEIFRLRLLRVFDNVLDMLKSGKLPSFYFDGQVCALLDYLEIRPENETLVRKFIREKKLFIGPFYTLIDEFLSDDICFRKNIEIGIKIAKDFGCEDFIAYFADTFGHSKNTIPILKEYSIDKCMVWRGVPENIPSEFIFDGINTVNMLRGYFMDIFSSKISIKEKADFLKKNLHMIAEKSSDVLLLPIGADHLGVEKDLLCQIKEVNALLDDYEIELSNPFEYFNLVQNNFKTEFNDELRNNSQTFILSGCYSSRRDLKQYFNECSYKLKLADDFQKKCGNAYEKSIEYAYKLLLQNLAHDGICGCSTDDVHHENIMRYKKVLQIAETIIEELKIDGNKLEFSSDFVEFESSKIIGDVISKNLGFEKELLYDTYKIPVTEDYKMIYTQLKEKKHTAGALKVNDVGMENSNVHFVLKDNQISLRSNAKIYTNLIEFVRFDDLGDTYNFAPRIDDIGEVAKFKTSRVVLNGDLRVGIAFIYDFFEVNAFLNKNSNLVNFSIDWDNKLKNKLWQVRFNLATPVIETISEDMGNLINRKFDTEYNMRKNLPKTKGIEVKTNFAPMQRFVWTQGLGIITKGLTEYEVYKNSISVTLLRSTGIISNPKNSARTTPAGPPIPTPQAQLLGKNHVEFSVGIFDVNDYKKYIDEIYPHVV